MVLKRNGLNLDYNNCIRNIECYTTTLHLNMYFHMCLWLCTYNLLFKSLSLFWNLMEAPLCIINFDLWGYNIVILHFDFLLFWLFGKMCELLVQRCIIRDKTNTWHEEMVWFRKEEVFDITCTATHALVTNYRVGAQQSPPTPTRPSLSGGLRM